VNGGGNDSGSRRRATFRGGSVPKKPGASWIERARIDTSRVNALRMIFQGKRLLRVKKKTMKPREPIQTIVAIYLSKCMDNNVWVRKGI